MHRAAGAATGRVEAAVDDAEGHAVAAVGHRVETSEAQIRTAREHRSQPYIYDRSNAKLNPHHHLGIEVRPGRPD
jgi:hypothetical protein